MSCTLHVAWDERLTGYDFRPDHPMAYGLGTEDDPVFAGIHEAAALVAGATLSAARAVWSGSRAARRQHLRRTAPRHARQRQRLLRL